MENITTLQSATLADIGDKLACDKQHGFNWIFDMIQEGMRDWIESPLQTNISI